MKILLAALLLLVSISTADAPDVPKLPNQKDFNCLVKNIYMESRGEKTEGKIAVGIVTINRLRHINYPKTLCKVVYQRKQFSWTNKTLEKQPINVKEWEQSVDAAYIAFNSKENFSATHYHNLTINPFWTKNKVLLTVIDNHKFYQ